MEKKDLTITSKLLLYFLAAGEMLRPILDRREFNRRFIYKMPYESYRKTLYYLLEKNLIRFKEKEQSRFVKLTSKGELEALLAKAKYPDPGKWDGKWRMVVFDIPEDSKDKRDKLRRLLKANNFHRLQASVYINPFPLNREAISYLQKTGLMDYIRIIKVEEMDDDKDLKKQFNL